MSDKHDQGEADFYKGKYENQNPYPANSKEAQDWNNGWWDALKEYEHRHKDYFRNE
jgi:hypothetical protein